jgi:hypothetical protein
VEIVRQHDKGQHDKGQHNKGQHDKGQRQKKNKKKGPRLSSSLQPPPGNNHALPVTRPSSSNLSQHLII